MFSHNPPPIPQHQVDGKWPPQHHYTEMLLTQAGSESSDGSVTYHIPTNTSEGCVTCHTSCHSPARKSDLESASGSSSNGSSAAHEHWVQKPTEDLSETIRKPIAWIWVTISLTIFIICTIGVTRSTWFTNSRTQASIGLVKHCRHQWQTDSMKCDFFKGGFAVKNLPSISWKVSLVLYLIGDALLGAGALVSLLCLITTTAYTRRQITFFAGYFQLFAAILLITALLIFPVGMDSLAVRSVCGDSGIFDPGECTVGWTYVLLLTCSAMCCLLPVLSHYTDYPLCNSKQEEKPIRTLIV